MKSFNVILALLLGISGSATAKDVELAVVQKKAVVKLSPFDKAWKNVTGVWVPLMAQTIAPPGGGGETKSARVKAIQTDHELLIRVDWADKEVNDYPSKSENFPDAVALQFPAEPSAWPSPFMGDRENAVVIWRWSASAQKDLEKGYQSSSLHRPRMTSDLYAYAGDATFRTGEGAGNIISNRRRVSPVENLAARGFGTLSVQDEQPVAGKGIHYKGRWYVVFRRELMGTPSFWQGSRTRFAVGVWDGNKRERNGVKSVSIWHTLALAEAGKRSKETKIERGHRVYRRFGCGTCHGIDANKGIANGNAQTNPIPALDRVKEGFSKEELLQVIYNGREPVRKDPNGAPPPFKMNAWKTVMDKSEGDALAAYLFSLMKEEEGSEW